MKIAKDKKLHFILSLLISLFITLFSFAYYILYIPYWFAVGFAISNAIAITLTIGWIKEYRDGLGYGTKDIRDLDADVFGTAVGVILGLFVILL